MPRSSGTGRSWVRVPRALDPLRLTGVVLVLALWSALSVLMSPALLPPPLAVAARLVADFLSAPELSYYGLADASLLGSMLYTGENVMAAVAIGASAGTLAGLVSARFGLVRAAIDPIMFTAGTIPMLVIAPFLLIWFGVGRFSAVLLVVFYVAVVLYLFAQRAADNLDPIYEEAALTLGATPRRLVRDVFIPGTVPEILGGLRIALAGSWGLEAISELLGSQEGMGKIIEVLAGATDVEGIMAALILLGAVAVAFDALAARLILRVAAWGNVAAPGSA